MREINRARAKAKFEKLKKDGDDNPSEDSLDGRDIRP